MVCSQQSKNDAFITQVRLSFLCSKSCSTSHFTERRGPYAGLKGLGHQLLSSSYLLLILQPHQLPFPFYRPHTPRPQNLGICPVMRTIFTQKSALFLLKCYILLWGLPWQHSLKVTILSVSTPTSLYLALFFPICIYVKKNVFLLW